MIDEIGSEYDDEPNDFGFINKEEEKVNLNKDVNHVSKKNHRKGENPLRPGVVFIYI